STGLFDGTEVTIDERPPQHRLPAPPQVASRLPGDGRERIYVYVRQSTLPNNGEELEATLLTAGGKATVLADVQELPESELTALLGSIGTPAFNLNAFGPKLAGLILPGDLLTVLGRDEFKDNHLVVVHDAPASRIPWESIKVGNRFPALEGGMSRRYIAGNM